MEVWFLWCEYVGFYFRDFVDLVGGLWLVVLVILWIGVLGVDFSGFIVYDVDDALSVEVFVCCVGVIIFGVSE